MNQSLNHIWLKPRLKHLNYEYEKKTLLYKIQLIDMLPWVIYTYVIRTPTFNYTVALGYLYLRNQNSNVQPAALGYLYTYNQNSNIQQ